MKKPVTLVALLAVLGGCETWNSTTDSPRTANEYPTGAPLGGASGMSGYGTPGTGGTSYTNDNSYRSSPARRSDSGTNNSGYTNSNQNYNNTNSNSNHNDRSNMSTMPANRTSDDPRTKNNAYAPGSGDADAKVLSILYVKDQEEIRIGRLAQQKASSTEARRYADMLVNEHSDHRTQVMNTANAAGLPLWDETRVKEELGRGGKPDPMTTLQSLSGAEFDRQFGQMMLEGHRELTSKIQSLRDTVQDQRVRELIEKTLPVLRRHEQMAASVAGVAGASGMAR